MTQPYAMNAAMEMFSFSHIYSAAKRYFDRKRDEAASRGEDARRRYEFTATVAGTLAAGFVLTAGVIAELMILKANGVF